MTKLKEYLSGYLKGSYTEIGLWKYKKGKCNYSADMIKINAEARRT